MAKRTSSGLLLPVIIVAGLVAMFGGTKALDTIKGFFSGDPIIIGTGDTAVMVASGAESKVEQCTATQILADKHCDDLKVVEINAAKMPFIARNIQLAWDEGQP